MHQDQTLLSYLATNFSLQPENLATESLGFILSRSHVARGAMGEILRKFGLQFEGELSFTTQSSSPDGARPDITALDVTQSLQALIEVKFWAGLTAAQPCAYLEMLPQKSGGILLFVCPEVRIPTLWPELLHRIGAPTSSNAHANSLPTLTWYSHSTPDSVLAITSWRHLLHYLLVSVESAGDFNCSGDIRQLQSLCNRMDSEAFLPLTSEEMTGGTARRITQFGDLVSALVDNLAARNLAGIKGMRSAASNGYFGRYFLLHGFGCFLTFHAPLWDKFGRTPVWLYVKDSTWGWNAEVHKALELNNIPCFEFEKSSCVPIDLPINVEYPDILCGALKQLYAVANVLAAIAPAKPAPPELATPPTTGVEPA